MIVYITTNLINGKKYIGQDQNDNKYYIGSGLLLKQAVKKYGRKNFSKEVLAYAKDKKDLDELEKYYIEYYNAQKSDLFYNISPGGTGGKISPEYFYRQRGKAVEVNINNFEIIKIYESQKVAALETGLNYKTINALCNNRWGKRFVNGRLFMLLENYSKENVEKILNREQYRNLALSLNTGVFYTSLTELWNSEYSYLSESSFKNKLHRDKLPIITAREGEKNKYKN